MNAEVAARARDFPDLEIVFADAQQDNAKQVADVENGARLETYLIAGPAGSGVVQPNGAAAQLIRPGDHVIVMAFSQVAEPLPEKWSPTIVLVDGQNRIREVRHG